MPPSETTRHRRDRSAKGEPRHDSPEKTPPARACRARAPPPRATPPRAIPPPRATPPRATPPQGRRPGCPRGLTGTLPACPGAPPRPSPLSSPGSSRSSTASTRCPSPTPGAFLAADGVPTWAQLVWITVAMVGARSAAMALNRLIDAELDARNPRTATRELPAGRLGRREVWLFTAVSVALLVARRVPAVRAVPLPLADPARRLRPLPYAKRFTWFCHYALGLTLGLAPAAAWLAVSGDARRGAVAAVLRRRVCGSAASTSSTPSSTWTSTGRTGCIPCRWRSARAAP